MLTIERPTVVVVSSTRAFTLPDPVVCPLMGATDAGFWDTLAALAKNSPLFAVVTIDPYDDYTLIVHPNISHVTSKPSCSYVWASPPDDRYGSHSDYAQLNDLAVHSLAGGVWRFRAASQPFPVLRCDPVWMSSPQPSPSESFRTQGLASSL
jgi:hypothetical protein